jgi:WD40 repeat protein
MKTSLANRIIAFVFCIGMVLLLPQPGKAQFYNGSQMSFGKNRVQYKDFLWTYYRFPKFDVYFYLNGKELAAHTAKYAQAYVSGLERKLQATFEDKDKFQFVIFNNMSDLKQSNIGLSSDQQFNTGGVTYIVEHKVFIYFDGDYTHFDKQIRAGIAKLLIDKTIHGGSIGTQIKNATLINFPDWYVNGLVSYYGEEWSTETDNIVRDGILSGRYRKFNHLMGDDALYAGHSMWEYIARHYGENNIPDIIYMARISKSVENGFLYVLGVPFKKLMKEWQAYYEARYQPYDKLEHTEAATQMNTRKKPHLVLGQLKINPDGQSIAYTTNEEGKYRVFIQDLGAKKKRMIFKRGHELDEKTDYTYPLLAWHPNGNILAMIIEAKGMKFLYFYSTTTHKFQKQFLYNFDKILDFSYAPDGRSFVFSAVQKGQSDIYLYTIASNSFEQLTRDTYNDLQPRFLEAGRKIIFSSNRPDDTLQLKESKKLLPEGLMTNDLFIYDFSSRSKALHRVNRTPYINETQPMLYQAGYFTYLSDSNGIINRFIAKFDSTITYVDTATHYRFFTSSKPLTNYQSNIIQQDANGLAGKYGEIIFRKNAYHLYLNNMPEAATAPTASLVNTPYMEELAIARNVDKVKMKARQEAPAVKVKKKKLVNVYDNETDKLPTDTSRIDINNYRLSKQVLPRQNIPGDTVNAKTRLTLPVEVAEFKMPKQRNYNVGYSINQLVSQIDFNFLNASYQPYTGGSSPIYLYPGLNVLFKVGGIDLLEDYRITGGVRVDMNFENNEYLLSFENLKHRIDRQIIFHRQSVEETGDVSRIRHRIHELHYILKYPFSEVFAIRGTAMVRYDKAAYLSTDPFNLLQPTVIKTWGALKAELIYDNTRNLGLNLYSGWRYKIFAEYFKLLDKQSKTLEVVGMDFRNYLKIHRTFIWANRFAASSSFGNSKLIYYMGGVDNWLNPKFNQENSVATGNDYAYQTLATNMRGFIQNIRNGNSFAVINSELRFPVFNYLFNRPIKSDFLNNFQIVGFADAGSAWTGLNPFSDDNTHFTRTINRKPLLITVMVQKNPIVAGYGAGLRSRLFGYFLRADWAWGVEDGQIQPRVFYFSLSLDF